MPFAVETTTPQSIRGGHEKARPRTTGSAVYSGSLDSYEHNDFTTSIGREIPGLQIKKILTLHEPNAEKNYYDLSKLNEALDHFLPLFEMDF